jgi:hypothetical protein
MALLTHGSSRYVNQRRGCEVARLQSVWREEFPVPRHGETAESGEHEPGVLAVKTNDQKAPREVSVIIYSSRHYWAAPQIASHANFENARNHGHELAALALAEWSGPRWA